MMVPLLFALSVALVALLVWRAVDRRSAGVSDNAAADPIVPPPPGNDTDAAFEAPRQAFGPGGMAVQVERPPSVVHEFHRPAPSVGDIAMGVLAGLWLFVLTAAAVGFVGFVAVLYFVTESR